MASVRVVRLRRGSSVQHPDARPGVAQDPRHGGHRFQNSPPGHRYRPGQRVQDTADDSNWQVVDAPAHQVIGGQILRNGLRRRRPRWWIALEVIDLREHLHAADTVGDRMADVQQHRRSAVSHTLHQGGRPQRARYVQRRLQNHLGEIEHFAQRGGSGHTHPTHMEVQIEVRIHHPARGRGRQGRHHHLLPQPQHPSRGVFESGPEAIPVRRAVQQFQRHDPRTSPRICLAPMHQIVDRPKLVGQPGGLAGLSHGHDPARVGQLDAQTLSPPIRPPASNPPPPRTTVPTQR